MKRFKAVRGNVSIEGVIWDDGSASVRVNGAAPTYWTAAQVDARRHPADGSKSDVVLQDPDEPQVDTAPAQPCDAPAPCPHDLAVHRYRPSGARDCTACDCLVANPSTTPARDPVPAGGGKTR